MIIDEEIQLETPLGYSISITKYYSDNNNRKNSIKEFCHVNGVIIVTLTLMA